MGTHHRTYPILILGGGFAGAYCARAALASLPSRSPDDVALIADQNVMLFHPMLAEVSGSSVSPLDVVNPLRRFCRGVSIFLGSVENVDLDERSVAFSPGPYVREAKLRFDQLVLAVGSIVDVRRVPGMAEHGYLMKTVGDAMSLRADIIDHLEEASVAEDEAVRRRLLTYVVVGGGYSGVETMGQIVDLLHGIRPLYPRIDPAEFRFVLVHSGDYLLPQIGPELGRYCENELKQRGVEIRLKTRVTAITAERAILEQEMIETNVVVSTVGNTTHPIIAQLIERYRLPNEKGRLLTEPTLRVTGHDWLWAIGDCAAVPSGGGFAPATAQFAIRQGQVAGKNLTAVRRHRALQDFKYQALGEMASLGHLNAVGKVFGIRVSGLLGWLLWRATYLYKLPGLERKIKVFFEWNLDLLFPRDISLLNFRRTDLVMRSHVEKGDPVYHVGDPAFSFYLIERGKISVLNGAGEKLVLGVGEYFGEKELLKNTRREFEVIAEEPSTLLLLDQKTFLFLTRGSMQLNDLFARSSLRYTTKQEKEMLLGRVSPALKAKKVSDLARMNGPSLQGANTLLEALRAFRESRLEILPVFSPGATPCWVTPDEVINSLHAGEADLSQPLSSLRLKPATVVPQGDSVENVLGMFAGTAERFFVVLGDGQEQGVLNLIDLIVESSEQPEPVAHAVVAERG